MVPQARHSDVQVGIVRRKVGCGWGLPEVAAAQVSGGSDRPPGGACVKRVSTVACCFLICAGMPAWGGRGGGGAIFAGGAAPGCWVQGCVLKPAVKDWCVREEASTAVVTETFGSRRTPSRDLHSRISCLSVGW